MSSSFIRFSKNFCARVSFVITSTLLKGFFGSSIIDFIRPNSFLTSLTILFRIKSGTSDPSINGLRAGFLIYLLSNIVSYRRPSAQNSSLPPLRRKLCDPVCVISNKSPGELAGVILVSRAEYHSLYFSASQPASSALFNANAVPVVDKPLSVNNWRTLK